MSTKTRKRQERWKEKSTNFLLLHERESINTKSFMILIIKEIYRIRFFNCKGKHY